MGFTIRLGKPSLDDGITGGWLVATVSTQSVSVLSGRLASHFAGYEQAVLFFSLCMFLIGCMLYLIVITLIFYRFMFFPLKPQEFEPLYWISMGAAAITTLAGTILAFNGHGSQLLQPIATVYPRINDFILGFRNMVDTASGAAGSLAARGPPREAVLHPPILEPRIPSRYVHHVHRAFVKSDRLGCSFDNSELFHIRGTFRLGHYTPGIGQVFVPVSACGFFPPRPVM